jgi:outer membrane protein assembly factor BamA
MNMFRICLLWLSLAPAYVLAVDAKQSAYPFVEGIDCTGNSFLSCSTIRSRSGITVGTELNEAEIEDARLRLEALPDVRAVNIHLIKGTRKQWVVVVIDVTGANPLTTAFAAGTLAQVGNPATQLETFAGRVTDHDLFGSGKSLDLAVVGAWPISGGGGAQYATRLEYVDAQPFDSRRYFFTAAAFYSHADFNFSVPPYGSVGREYQNAGAGFDVSLGMHLDSNMYVTAGYRYLYLQNTASNDQYLTSDGVITTLSSSPGSVALFTVGRNTEDDPSFPTRGWLLHAYDGWQPLTRHDFAGVVVRGTWAAGSDSWWTFQARPFDDFRSIFDDDLGVSIIYSQALFAGSAARRARWYVGPGATNLGHSLGPRTFELGIKAGVRLETKYLGTVNFYAIASHTVQSGN